MEKSYTMGVFHTLRHQAVGSCSPRFGDVLRPTPRESAVRTTAILSCLSVALLLLLPASVSAQVLFAKTTIAELGSFQGATAVETADIDGDGDIDVVGAA